MTADAIDDAWMEEALIAICKLDGSNQAFMALTETIDFDLGGKDIEGIPLSNGGRVTKWVPEGDSTVTMEMYPLEAGSLDSATPGTGAFDLMHSVDAVVPIRVVNSRNRDLYRIVVMWTNDSTAATAEVTTAANASALRIGLADGYFTSVKPSFTDGILKFTVVYKCTAFDKSGNGNMMVESCAGATALDVLPVLADYDTDPGSSNKKFD